jgi:hypothetical protein
MKEETLFGRSLFLLAILVAMLIFATSCGTVKKLITHTNSITDSTTRHTVDTSFVKKAESKSNSVDITNLSLTIKYPAVVGSGLDTQVYDTSTYIGKIEHFVNHTHPSEITINIGKLKDSASHVITLDSSSIHYSDTTNVHKSLIQTIRDVNKKQTPAWLIVASLVAALLVIVWLFIHFNIASLIKKII